MNFVGCVIYYLIKTLDFWTCNSFVIVGGIKRATSQTEDKISATTNFITNENFAFRSEASKSKDDKCTATTLTEDSEKTLQSPVESHFALTPVTGSETSSPANGFTSQDCTDLLQQELDKLDTLEIEKTERSEKSDANSNVTNLPHADTLLSPSDEHVNMFSRSNTPVKVKEQISDGVKVENYDNNSSGEVSNLYYLDFCSERNFSDVDVIRLSFWSTSFRC